MALKKIAIGGISTECSSYSPLYQLKDDFKSIQDQALLDLVDFPFSEFEIKTYPLFFNKSVPGGPIEKEYFTQLKNQFIEDLHSLGELNGVLLLMHGAMYVDGIEDPEGEWIASVRKEVGSKCIISVSFDLHGQITNQIICNIDAFAAFKTAPHIDVKETYQRSSMMLCKALNENYRPYVLWSAIPVLVSGEMSSTLLEPCQSIYESLELYNQESNILDCNLMIGYVWADTKRATAASVVTCTDEKSGAIICKSIANLYWDNRKKLNYGMMSGDINSALDFFQDDFSIIADSGDNPTAGGVGDRADILKVILEVNSKETLIAGIASKSAYDELKNGNQFTIGGTFGGGGPSFILTADTVYFENQCAIAKVNKTTIVVTELRRSFHKLKDFTDLKINLRSFQLLVVKSGYLSPDLQGLSVSSFMVLSDGAVNQDLSLISNKQRNKKTYPFQDFNDFTPEASNGKSIVS
jgi:microcystin degradation protein MlrC